MHIFLIQVVLVIVERNFNKVKKENAQMIYFAFIVEEINCTKELKKILNEKKKQSFMKFK